MTELNRAMTSTLLSVQSRSDQTDRDQGNGQLKPNQVRVSESSSVTETDYSVLCLRPVHAQFSTMATGQEIIPVGDAAAVLYDDTSMNSSNGPPSPIVVEPGDREGPTAEEPERAFYMYAPQFHWTVVGGEDQPARSAVESIAREQYRFGTQTEECHRRLLMGQVEAERRIIELEARVAKLQDELAVQDQRIQEQRRHYEESLGKMEASYRLLQQRVTQEQGSLKAEFARRIGEQTQTLRDTLHKGIADMITAQLTPVYTELTALQTRSADFEDLAARMAQAEAHRDELVDKVLEIEEKEDNHIAYLEAQLAGLSVAEEEEKKLDDDLEARGAAVLQDLGLIEPQTTQPPVTSCDADSRYRRFCSLHGQESSGTFDISWSGAVEYAGAEAVGTKRKKKTNRVLGRVRTRVSCLLGEWYCQEQRPQQVSWGFHRQCPQAEVVQYRGRFRQWEMLVGI